jgi:hypothetical protein
MDAKISQWYYVYNGQQQGPVDEGTMQQLMQNRMINANTLVWQVGMPSWLPLQSTSLQALVPVTNLPPAPPPVAPVSAAPYYGTQVMPQAAVNAESLKQLFMVFWILLAVSVPLVFIYIGFFTLIAALVIGYILLYRYWQVIQDGNVRTTPGKAVGYTFIPFFSFYWIFPAYYGLAQDMNRYVRERNIQAPAVSEGMGLAYCILSLVFPPVNLIFLIILFNDLTKTSEAIIKSRINR